MSLRVQIDGTEYSVRWQHTIPQEKDKDLPEWAFLGTDCVIEEKCGDSWREVYEGSSNLHPMDRFDKEKGRKVSLARALTSWPRDKRAKIWSAYFGRKS